VFSIFSIAQTFSHTLTEVGSGPRAGAAPRELGKSVRQGQQARGLNKHVFVQRFVVAALLLVMLGCAAAAVQGWVIERERARGEVIAIAAEQGALSQRITFLAASINQDGLGCKDFAACSDLEATAQRMARNHDILTGQLEQSQFTPFIQPLRDLYAAGEPTFSDKVAGFVGNAQALASQKALRGVDRPGLVEQIRFDGSTSLFQTHRLMVEVLEAEAERSIRFAHIASSTILGGSLVLIALSFIRIFRPMVRNLQVALAEAEKARLDAQTSAEQAQRATRARGAFLKTASHELKTPLNAIMGLADMIKAGHGEEQELITEMQHASDHLLSMLNTMLDTHRLDEGRLELAPAEHGLKQELALTGYIGQNLAQRKGLRFNSNIDLDSTLRVRIDSARLRQVCLNLLDNAVRYTERGAVGLDARIIEDGEADILDLVVHDTGVGISDERLGVVFDRYTSAQSSEKGQGAGIGLGLALTQTIVQLMGGSITINSKVGRGTDVIVRIPLDTCGFSSDEMPELSNVPAVKPRILIVDDNQPNRMVADTMMTSLGCETTLAEDGSAALKLALRKRYDLILMDIAMPVMDGVESTINIRRTPGPNRSTPIIAITAHVAPEDVEPMLHHGFDQVMHKPMRRHLMAPIVAQYGAVANKTDRQTR